MLVIAVSAPPVSAATPAVPIPSIPVQPTFSGAPGVANPIHGITAVPHNPFMAPNGESEIHNDAWQTDAYRWAGPLGRSPVTFSTLISHDCGSIAFDSRGRLVSVCVGVGGPELFMIDPRTLATIATFALPPRQDVPTNIFQDFTGGGYFYLDARDRVVTATTTRHIYVIAETASHDGFRLAHDYDLSHVLRAGEKITSALPDSRGLLWFVARSDGVVGTVALDTGRVRTVRLGHGAENEIENSFATDQAGGVYVATNRELLRFGAGRAGAPKIIWRVRYPNSGLHKPGQVDDGTGTTPTVMAGGFVSITDNADPMDVVVYRVAPRLAPRVPRSVCRVPVFRRGASATENSIVAAGRAMVVENNYGYSGPPAVTGGVSTAPGFARVDINPGARGCRRIWTNSQLSAPTVVPKLSLATGLVYAYTKPRAAGDPWYWTTLSFRTGRTVFRRFSGTGISYNNNYAGIAISRRGTAYLGTIGGIVALRDGR